MGRRAHFSACLAGHFGLLLLPSVAKEKCAYLEEELIKVTRGEEAELRIQVETFTSSTVTILVLLPTFLMSGGVTIPNSQASLAIHAYSPFSSSDHPYWA